MPESISKNPIQPRFPFSANIMSGPTSEYQPADVGFERPTNPDTIQNDYKSRKGQSHIPVQSDDAPVDDSIDSEAADSDEMLGQGYSMTNRLD